MAAEPQLQPQQNYTALAARPPTIRPQTRSKIIEILAGNANGCLQELGYTPALLERIRQFEELTPKLKASNDDLLSKGKAWEAHAHASQAKAERYKAENVKLYEDNVKLVADCSALRTQLASMQKRCIVYEESRGKDGAELLQQYANLAEQYEEAVKELQRQNSNATVSAQPPRPQASGSQMREIRPTFVPSQQPLRRASAPGPQQHPPTLAHGQHIPPRAYPSTIQVPLRHHTSSAPIGWQQLPSPFPPTPTSASTPSSTNAYSALGPPYSDRGNMNVNAATSMAPYPPTPPMSALPLNLQNFASPASQRAPARTASASSSQSQRTPVAMQSPALPSAPTSVPPTPPEVPQEITPPDEMQEDIIPPETHQASTPPEAHEAITPPPHTVVDASGVLLSDSLKRTSLSVEGEDPRKRPRLEEPDVKIEMKTEEVSDVLPVEADDDEEDGNEVDYIEVGPDGLRTIPDCVNAVFDPDEGTVCRFCMARYDEDGRKGRPSERPQRLAGASVAELAAHCETEHNYAWGLLRQNV